MRLLWLCVVAACSSPKTPRATPSCGAPPPAVAGTPGRQVIQAPDGQGTTAIAFGDDGLVLAGNQESVQLWSLTSRMLLRTIAIPGSHYQIAWSGNDRFVVATGTEYDPSGRGAFVEYDLTGKRLRELSADWRVVRTSSGAQLQRVVVRGDQITVQRNGGVERTVTLAGWTEEDHGKFVGPIVAADDSAVAVVSYDNSSGHATVLHTWHFDGASPQHREVTVPGLALKLELAADGERARLELSDYPTTGGSVVLVPTRGGKPARLGGWDYAWAMHNHTSTATSADAAWAATVVHAATPIESLADLEASGRVVDYMRRDEAEIAGSARTLEMRRAGQANVIWRWSTTATGAPIGDGIADVYFTGNHVVVALFGGQLIVLDRERGTVLGRMGAMPAVARHMIAPDAGHLRVLLDSHRVVEWDLARARPTELGEIEGSKDVKRTRVELARDRVYLSGPDDGEDPRTAPLITTSGTYDALPSAAARKPLELPGIVRAISFVEQLAVVDHDATCAVVDLKTRTAHELQAYGSACNATDRTKDPTTVPRGPRGGVTFAFQAGHVIAYWTIQERAGYTRVVSMWDATGKQVLFAPIAMKPVTAIVDGTSAPAIYDIPLMSQLSPDHKTLAMANHRTLWRITAAGAPSTTIDARIASVAWLPGGDLMVSREDGVVERHHTDGRVERASGDALAISVVSPDGAWFAGPGRAGSVRVWTTSPFAPAATLLGFQDHEYLAYTPDGYFAGTPEAADRVAMVFDEPFEAFTFEQYADEFRKPATVAARLAGKATAATPIAHRPPRLELAQPVAAGATARVHASVASRGRVDLVRFFVDGRPAGAQTVCAATGAADIDVPLHAGTNRITAVAYDASGLASRWETREVAGPTSQRLPKVWVVAVGVSKYEKLSADQQLQLADDDARAIADAFRGGGAFREADVQLMVDAEATPARVLGALDRLKDMAVDDLAVVFLAGHGAKPAGDAEMVFLTSAASFDHLDAAIRWRDVAARLAPARGRILVLLDACHSGHFARDRVASNDDLAGAFATAGRAGALVFSAAKGRQPSFEPSGTRGLVRTKLSRKLDGEHGLFTAALLGGLADPTTDANRNGDIELSELIAAATERVGELSGGRQTPWIARREIHGDLRVGIAARGAPKPPEPVVAPAPVDPLAIIGTTWTFCGGGATKVTFAASGKVIWAGGLSCGDAKWTQAGAKVTFDCNDFTRWDVTIENGEMEGEWYRIKDPTDRSPTCLEKVSP